MAGGATLRTRVLMLFGLGALALLWLLTDAQQAHAQTAGADAVGAAFADGGEGGSARGGDGGRGGSGDLAVCSSNTNAAAGFADDLECQAGGAGGGAGAGGESRGGNGGLAFSVGGPPPPPPPPEEEAPTPVAVADLAVSNTGPTAVHGCVQGCSTIQTVTVTNVGQATATAATLTDSISSGGAVIVNAVANGAPCAANGVPSPNVTIQCALGDLAPGASVVILVELTFTLGSGDELATSTATASTPSPESSYTNNQAALAVMLFVV